MVRFKFALLFILGTLFSYSQTFSDSIEICKDGNIDYEAFNPQALSWEWSFKGGVPDTSTQQTPQNINYPDTGEFITYCISTFQNGEKDTNYIKVRVRTDLLDSILLRDTSICSEGTLLLYSHFDSINSKYNYLWTSSTLSIDEIFVTTPTLRINKPGSYTLRVFTSCSWVEKTIQVKSKICAYNLHIPNSFTPNKDYLNETYSIYVETSSYFNIRIYNRWGEKMYESNNPNFKWDGNYKNTPVPTGVYVVVVEAFNPSRLYKETLNILN